LVIFLGNILNSNISKVRVLGRAGEQSEVMIHALLKQVDGLESKNGEDDRAGVDGGEAVAEGDDEDVLDTVLLRAVVGTKADDGAES